MGNYVVSARKYRPNSFDSLVGQDVIAQTLKNAIKNDQLAQAFLFNGSRGVGKTSAARILAKLINCASRTENIEACNQCESCRSIDNGNSFNIYELDAASNNGVEAMRGLTDQVRIPPQIGKYKVYIIDEVHMLSASAFNAFLKTLEEPPSHAIFILATTEKHKVIPTILSRCQIFDFLRIKIVDIVDHLKHVSEKEGIQVEDDSLHLIAQKSDGGMRDALSIFDQIVSYSGKTISYKDVADNLNILDYDYYFKLVECAITENIHSSLLIFKEINDRGHDAHQFLVGYSEHFRNLLMCKDTSTIDLLEVSESIKSSYLEQANKLEVDFIIRALGVLASSDSEFKTSLNTKLHIELTILQLCSIQNELKKKA